MIRYKRQRDVHATALYRRHATAPWQWHIIALWQQHPVAPWQRHPGPTRVGAAMAPGLEPHSLEVVANAMADSERGRALFAGLISNEEDEPVEVTYLGKEAFYVIPDGDFRRHVEAAAVDDAVLAQLHEQISGQQDLVTQGVLEFLGKDDLFTKASIDLALKNFEQGFRQADPEQWRPMLGMLGFRVIVNVHGEVVRVDYPTQEIDDE
jgi:hypothetical protein